MHPESNNDLRIVGLCSLSMQHNTEQHALVLSCDEITDIVETVLAFMIC